MSNEAPAVDWAEDVKRYVPGADNDAIAGIVHHSMVALKTRCSSLLTFGNPAETRRVRESFCKQTLGLTDPDAALDSAIAEVGQRMSDTTSPHRVTAYYLLADHFGRLGQFSAGPKPAAEPSRSHAPWAATMFDGPPPATAVGGPSSDIEFAALAGLGGAVLAFAVLVANTPAG